MNDSSSWNLKSAGSKAIILKTLFGLCITFVAKLILSLLHQLCSLFLIAEDCVNNNLFKLKSLKHLFFRTDSFYDDTLILNEKLFFKKIPQHMTLIVSNESPSYKDLINVIRWSIPAGISHISFYDHHNSIHSEALFDYACTYADQYIPLIKWGKSFSEDMKLKSKTLINGYKWRPTITVHIYKRGDWPNTILNCLSCLDHCDSISVKELESVLRKPFLAPDPDLAVVVGNTLSFFGFLPWYLRITQLQKISSHHNITVHSFLRVLQEYSNSEQRYGK